MLLRVGIGNFRSIRDYQQLHLTAARIKDDAGDVIDVPGSDLKALRVLGLYGPNASGKTNVLSAIQFLSAAVRFSYTKGEPEGPIPIRPFRLNPSSRDEPVALDADFVIADVRYHFGVKLGRNRVEEEWLYAYPHGKRQVWYHRDPKGDSEYYFGTKLKGRNATIAELTRPNSLFLSAAAQHNHEQLTGVHQYFARNIRVHNTDRSLVPKAITEEFQNPDRHRRYLEFLKKADVGIVDVIVEDVERDDDQRAITSEALATDLNQVIQKHLGEKAKVDLSSAPTRQLKFVHQGANQKAEAFSLTEESRGTITLINAMPAIVKALDDGAVLLIDEIESSLHPYLSQMLVSIFNRKETNPKNAQLIFATHDVTLLSQKYMRRDQAWFTVKREDGSTKLFPLTDISTRLGDNISKGYMEGRFGAVPSIPSPPYIFVSGEES